MGGGKQIRYFISHTINKLKSEIEILNNHFSKWKNFSIMIVDVLDIGFDVESYSLVCRFRVLRPFTNRPKYITGSTVLRNYRFQINNSNFIFNKVRIWVRKIQKRFTQVTTIRILAFPLSKKYQSVLFRLRYLDQRLRTVTTRPLRNVVICLSLEEETTNMDFQIRHD